jgi:hypothetical protein
MIAGIGYPTARWMEMDAMIQKMGIEGIWWWQAHDARPPVC